MAALVRLGLRNVPCWSRRAPRHRGGRQRGRRHHTSVNSSSTRVVQASSGEGMRSSPAWPTGPARQGRQAGRNHRGAQDQCRCRMAGHQREVVHAEHTTAHINNRAQAPNEGSSSGRMGRMNHRDDCEKKKKPGRCLTASSVETIRQGVRSWRRRLAWIGRETSSGSKALP